MWRRPGRASPVVAPPELRFSAPHHHPTIPEPSEGSNYRVDTAYLSGVGCCGAAPPGSVPPGTPDLLPPAPAGAPEADVGGRQTSPRRQQLQAWIGEAAGR